MWRTGGGIRSRLKACSSEMIRDIEYRQGVQTDVEVREDGIVDDGGSGGGVHGWGVGSWITN